MAVKGRQRLKSDAGTSCQAVVFCFSKQGRLELFKKPPGRMFFERGDVSPREERRWQGQDPEKVGAVGWAGT